MAFRRSDRGWTLSCKLNYMYVHVRTYVRTCILFELMIDFGVHRVVPTMIALLYVVLSQIQLAAITGRCQLIPLAAMCIIF